MNLFSLVMASFLLAGCVHFEPKPISPAKSAALLENRSLTNAAIKTFLEENLHHELAHWPHSLWDFDMLTLAAFYNHPSLDVARAQWHIAQAAVKTAGGRPNPTLSLTPGYSVNPASGVSPWFPAINFDIPIETAGKRGKRISTAEHLSESARLNIATAAWKVRSNLRSALIDSASQHKRVTLMQGLVSAQEQIVHRLEQQADAGDIARSQLASSRITLQKSLLELADAKSRMIESHFNLANAIGISVRALDDVELSFDPLEDFDSPTNLVSAEVRQTALTSRSDILAALADYAAAEAALQLEIAKQYPDVHLNPGYQFDQGENKWSLGISVDLPIFNRNRGPIAEAEARREEAAARFNELQANVLSEIERAIEIFRVSRTNLVSLESLARMQANQLSSVQAQWKAGAADRIDYLNVLIESETSALAQLDAQSKMQQSLGALEDAVQRPMFRSQIPSTVFEQNSRNAATGQTADKQPK